MNINPLNDAENRRKLKNLTNSQKKNTLNTKEGVLVNTLVKDENSLSATKDTYMISDRIQMPEQLYQDGRIVDKKLVPLSAIAIGVMASVAALTCFVERSANVAKNLAPEKWLPAVTRNVNLSKETSQVIYQMIQSPNKKTFIAGSGVLALSAMAFMGKTFFDGYKEIWVKRREANIQKNLQENLVEVETQAFSGKMQIIRSMLSKYTSDFEKYITDDEENKHILQNFEKNLKDKITFTSQDKNNSQKSSNLGNIILGLVTTLGIVGFGFVSLKNLSKSKGHLQDGLSKIKEAIVKIVDTSNNETKKIDKNNLEHLFMSIEGSQDSEKFVTEQINKLNWESKEEKAKFLEKVLTKFRTSSTKVNPNIGGDGTPKPAFNSFVDDYRAFFYNWLIDTENPQFKQLFLGITGITAVSYGGKLVGDALKEVQVKKINADTELELQKRLVSTELRNFKAKKDAAIQPLVDEFYKQADSGKRTKSELKTIAENVLFEVKNGPPYVYS